MTTRPRSHQLESLSRTKVREVFERAGWTIEDLGADYGEDLFVRIFKKGKQRRYHFSYKPSQPPISRGMSMVMERASLIQLKPSILNTGLLFGSP